MGVLPRGGGGRGLDKGARPFVTSLNTIIHENVVPISKKQWLHKFFIRGPR